LSERGEPTIPCEEPGSSETVEVASASDLSLGSPRPTTTVGVRVRHSPVPTGLCSGRVPAHVRRAS